jgi:hypothetical protein
MAMISDNIARLKTHIAQICQKAGRNPNDITIVGITKYSIADEIKEALSAGIQHIGENKVQQAAEKYPALANVVKHMVGHLQTNKVKNALELFDIIQSVDSFRLAEEIDRQCLRADRRAQILVQVNAASEEQKFGAALQDVNELFKRITDLKAVDVLGLMAMGPLTEDRTAVRDCFKKTKDLYRETSGRFFGFPNIQMEFLSMGMSDDYDIALEEGANMLRLGRIIFTDTAEKATS